MAAALWFGWSRVDVRVRLAGPADGAVLLPSDVVGHDVIAEISPATAAASARLTVDGALVPATSTGGRVVWTMPDLADGPHTLAVTVRRPLLGAVERTVRFVVDGTPPVLSVPLTAAKVDAGGPAVVEGTVEAGATVTVAGRPATVEGTRFRATFPTPPPGVLAVVATDAAGNRTEATTIVPVRRPATVAVHVTSAGWADPKVKATVMRLVDERRIDAVQLDIKDETGRIGFRSAVPLAREIGATTDHYDLRQAVDELHAKGVRVIGRLVAFRDPILAAAAWARGDRDWVLQNAAGEPLAAYGGFTNYVHPEVRRYNLDLAVEAARAGFDEILWDYIRRPEGSPSQMRVAGLTGRSAVPVASFLAEAQALLRPLGVLQGASVFGIAATRPDHIGQDLTLIAPHVEYVAPMVYPSHWGAGEYGVRNPNAQPYDIVSRSLADFRARVAGTGAVVVPWLQDFTLGDPPYGVREVQAQIRAAADQGIDSYLLWNAGNRYTVDALPAGAR